MDPLWILVIGVVVVVGSILVLRLHAFLALVLGALAVAWLTPRGALQAFELKSRAPEVVSIDDDGQGAELDVGRGHGVAAGAVFYVLRPAEDHPGFIMTGEVVVSDPQQLGDEHCHVRAREPGGFTIRPGDPIVHAKDHAAALEAAGASFATRVAAGFGSTAGKIGILIAMASIIGTCLLHSGAADQVVRSALRIVGERRGPLALLGSSFTLGIPVFFDTVFYLMIPLGKAMRMRTGRNYLLYIVAIVAGGTMAHSLVPPTPGPLFVAGALDVDLGVMMLGGLVVGSVTVTVGYLYAVWANRRWEIPLRETADAPLAELEALVHRDARELPPAWLAVLPILLPVVLIAGRTALTMAFKGADAADLPGWYVAAKPVVAVLGDKNIALILAAAVALAMLAWSERTSPRALADRVQASLASGGVIILITAAGGAFGGVLRQTGIAGVIEQWTPDARLALLPIAFLVTTFVRTAQGSATVSMITSVGIFAPTALAGDLGFHPLYLALAIGCGSKPVSWMNDSGFWVIGRMSGMTEAETLKTSTMVMIVMAVAGLAVTVLGAWLLPMAPAGS